MIKNNNSSPSIVTVIGAANIDLTCFSDGKIVKEDSNPAKMKLCPGGVGRNIAANLALLNINPRLIVSLGDDSFSLIIKADCEKIGIDIGDSLFSKGEISPTYIAFLENTGEMNVAMSCMDIMDKLTAEYLQSKKSKIAESEIIVLDTNIPASAIGFICRNFRNSQIYIDTVSVKKSEKIKEHINYFHTIKMNKLESEHISGITINSEADLKACGDFFLEKGVKRVFITLGAQGAYYADESVQKKFSTKKITPVNVTGAGDAYMAGVVYSSVKGFCADKTLRFCAAIANEALLSEETINTEINETKILKTIE